MGTIKREEIVGEITAISMPERQSVLNTIYKLVSDMYEFADNVADPIVIWPAFSAPKVLRDLCVDDNGSGVLEWTWVVFVPVRVIRAYGVPLFIRNATELGANVSVHECDYEGKLFGKGKIYIVKISG